LEEEIFDYYDIIFLGELGIQISNTIEQMQIWKSHLKQEAQTEGNSHPSLNTIFISAKGEVIIY
jgi:hypothetical protein